MPDRTALNLLPAPRSLKLLRGTFALPEKSARLFLGSARAPRAVFGALAKNANTAAVRAIKIAPDGASAPTREGACAPQSEFYSLKISKSGIEIAFRETGGLRAALATLRQLLRQSGRRLPCLKIRDWPDFSRRGVMLDISRGRVPKLETLLDLAGKLADFKINELQLYTEHTFAYRKYASVWQGWGALTAKEIQVLDARCRELGIDLVPNQNSFGHLREFLAQPALKKLGEMSGPYESGTKDFLRRPTTLAPNHPGTLPFLRGLYDELLPNFSSRFFNVGCDETWDLGRGRSRELCKIKGKGRVYLDFLKQIHREVSARGKRMMFWGDIILKYPELIPNLASFGVPPSGGPRSKSTVPPEGGTPSLITLTWGYEANHPFAKEAAQFAKAKIPFYVCPGTSTWQTLVGKHDNALVNLRAAAKAGKESGALGYLVTDWGDGGHPQPLAVSWPMFAAGAALAWNGKHFDEHNLVFVLGRDIYGNAKVAKTAFRLGFVHQKLGVTAPNETPLGTVIAAPPLRERELFCRNGLKWFSRIPAARIRAALKAIEKFRAVLRSGVSEERRHLAKFKSAALYRGAATKFPAIELDLVARMAAQSCKFMLWQQAVAAGKISGAKRLARLGIIELKKLEQDFNALWPLQNKATPKHCSAFLRWRMEDYRRGFAG
jgi:hexosaminidase